jgi:hypothetical protein
MSTAPQDLAAARWKPIKRALEDVARAEAAHDASRARLEELRAAISPATYRDRQALGEALVAGKSEPPPEAEQLQQELEVQERRADALALAVETAHGRIRELVVENKADWRGQAVRSLAQAKSRYETSITEIEAAREGLSDEAALISWLDSGAGVAAASDPLGGRWGSDASGRAPMSFARVLEELRADAEAIAQHPLTRDDPAAEPRLELAWRG